MNPLQPDVALLCKLGSVIVHADELLSPDGREPEDRIAFVQALNDPAVQEWIREMNAAAFLPVKRIR